jgi:hypothetical protein
MMINRVFGFVPIVSLQEYKPMIFANGQRVQFPGPTKVKSGTEGLTIYKERPTLLRLEGTF